MARRRSGWSERRRRRGEPDEGRYEGAALELSGPEPLRPADQVAVLAAALGRPLVYEPLDDATARAELEAGTPTPFVDALFRFFSDGEYDDSRVVDTVERVLRRPPRRFADWAAAHAAASHRSELLTTSGHLARLTAGPEV